MATTARPIEILANGLRDTTGAVVASGKCRFYQPGTLTRQTVYSDSACSTALTQPVTLSAGGQSTVYTLEAVRLVAKDSTETTTYYDDIVNLNRADAVYVTVSGVNSGEETTLESVLTTAVTSFGAGFQYKESTGATARNWVDVMGDLVVSVKDFGATGDGVADDTAEIQAACDRVETRGGGIVFFPEGTYKISAAISVDTAGVSLLGVGPKISIIKNYSTTANAFTINLGSAVDARLSIRELSITADTTSSGAAITVTNGDRIVIENVWVALHRSGIVASAVTGAYVNRCVIESTDDNAAAVGINVGTRGRVNDCEIVSGTDNGTGLTLGADARAIDTYISNFATGATLSTRAVYRGGHISGPTTGASLTGSGAQIEAAYITGATTGVSLGADYTAAFNNTITSCTTGISVGAFANCKPLFNSGASNTTDLTANSSATLLTEHNSFSTYSNTAATTFSSPTRFRLSSTTSAAAAPSWTPTHTVTQINLFESTYAGATALTIAAPVTTNAQYGDVLYLLILQTNGAAMTITWNAIYADAAGGTGSLQATVLGTAQRMWIFWWDGAEYRLISSGEYT